MKQGLYIGFMKKEGKKVQLTCLILTKDLTHLMIEDVSKHQTHIITNSYLNFTKNQIIKFIITLILWFFGLIDASRLKFLSVL